MSRVLLAYEDRVSALVDEIVYDQKTPIALPAAMSWTYFESVPYTVMNGDVPETYYNAMPHTGWAPGVVTLRLQGMDLTRWEREMPLLFTMMNTQTDVMKALWRGCVCSSLPRGPKDGYRLCITILTRAERRDHYG